MLQTKQYVDSPQDSVDAVPRRGENTEPPLIAIRSFIQATCDSGYKSSSSAIAELIDNSLEAHATEVDVLVLGDAEGGTRISVTDNGTGMLPAIMRLALQFGGSTRFNSRGGTGRYGMGLPNGSLSQARRVALYSWTNPDYIWSTYLDADEVATGVLDTVPPPTRVRVSVNSPSGTTVMLSKCDRLDCVTVNAQVRRFHLEFGRMFRRHLYEGRVLRINGETVKPIDPLFCHHGNNLVGAEAYGPAFSYEISTANGTSACSSVWVRFVVLPMESWYTLSNEDKNKLGISKGAGVSILRAGREIDYGWYFMGSKRKENYDDWWRCEISFSPELDERFGVTHTKQKINPTQSVKDILVPDIERIARELNALVRKRYLAIRNAVKKPSSTSAAEQKDHLLEPLRVHDASIRTERLKKSGSRLGYSFDEEAINDLSFYVPSLVRNDLKVVLNRDHHFYKKVYERLTTVTQIESKQSLEHLQLLLLAVARAECSLRSKSERQLAVKLRERWSNVLTAFLS